MYNAGVELDLSVDIIREKDLLWSISGNITSLKNKITELPIDPFTRNSGFQRVHEGYSQYNWWLLQWAGVDPSNGDGLYIPREDATNTKTVNGILVTNDINQAKDDWSGDAMPKFFGGFGTNFRYKNINLSVFFNYQLGGKMYNHVYSYLMSPNYAANSALHKDLMNRWTTPGQNASIPRLDDGTTAASLRAARSTRWLMSSNMLELSNFNLSYDLPQKFNQKLGVRLLRVYASGNNIYMFTKIKGSNPVFSPNSGYNNNPDLYNPARTITFGINIHL